MTSTMTTVDQHTGEVITVVPPSALSGMVKSEIEAQVDIAKKYPRSLTRFKQDAVTMATLDEDTARSCIYALPRGGKNIEGPSIRLAEMIASAWGNMRMEARIVDEGDRFVTARGVAFDMERNTLVAIEVQRRITHSKGGRYNDDMIGVTGNAAASIALRNAIFRVIPNAYVQYVYSQARMCALGDIRTLASRRGMAVEWFGKAGIPLERLLATLGKSGLDDIDQEAMLTLSGFRSSIQDGTANIDDLFPAQAGELKTGTSSFGFQKPAPAAIADKQQAPLATGEQSDWAQRAAKAAAEDNARNVRERQATTPVADGNDLMAAADARKRREDEALAKRRERDGGAQKKTREPGED